MLRKEGILITAILFTEIVSGELVSFYLIIQGYIWDAENICQNLSLTLSCLKKQKHCEMEIARRIHVATSLIKPALHVGLMLYYRNTNLERTYRWGKWGLEARAQIFIEWTLLCSCRYFMPYRCCCLHLVPIFRLIILPTVIKYRKEKAHSEPESLLYL